MLSPDDLWNFEYVPGELDYLGTLEGLFEQSGIPFSGGPRTARAFSGEGISGLSPEEQFSKAVWALGYSDGQLADLLAGATAEEIGPGDTISRRHPDRGRALRSLRGQPEPSFDPSVPISRIGSVFKVPQQVMLGGLTGGSPGESLRNMNSALAGGTDFRGRDVGGVRLLPEDSWLREGLGLGAEVVFDPLKWKALRPGARGINRVIAGGAVVKDLLLDPPDFHFGRPEMLPSTPAGSNRRLLDLKAGPMLGDIEDDFLDRGPATSTEQEMSDVWTLQNQRHYEAENALALIPFQNGGNPSEDAYEALLGELYWSTVPAADPRTGQPDIEGWRAVREEIARQAEAFGLDLDFVTGTGPGTYRDVRFIDPDVADAVERFERNVLSGG